MIARTITAAALIAIATPGLAQTSPYAAEPRRTIKALSNDEVSGLLDGAGMGFARAAELNGMPGPRHSLDLAAELHLTDEQRGRLEDLFARMQAQARRLGRDIVERERRLDDLFASGTITAEQVAAHTTDLGRLYGQLRATHLAAHLETAALLEPHQVRRYSELRGYADSGGGGEHQAHH